MQVAQFLRRCRLDCGEAPAQCTTFAYVMAESSFKACLLVAFWQSKGGAAPVLGREHLGVRD